MSTRFVPTIEKSRKRKPYRRHGDKQDTYVVSGTAFVPVQCQMRVVAWNKTDAENEAAAIWHENFRERHKWVIPGTVDERHPGDWACHAEVEGSK